MSLTQLLIPTYTQMLRTLAGLLAKAEDTVPQADALLAARLAPDMLPLSSQVRFAVFQAQEAAYRLTGDAVPDWLHSVAAEGRNADENPGSMAEARSRVHDALAFLGKIGRDALDTGAGQAISLELPNGIVFDMTGEQYARDWALAQFYFHVGMAYAILRSQGIALGKADYVPHMFAYLRPEAARTP
ncbi:DUF1993 domain-containing protein [Methylobacterium sp. J-090]|uniref:DUF1993 family protein n=1 Tax=Methylobacterium sp. J-090 TaxID=2836666 RepID=UPI001FBAAEDD|nr:DUF1993 domain-containing protein [Methylobacterium sp. J-090]MCJ2083583.1 DUF1993 domain-containing protein [Methylobacterium sp. J-090]